MSEFVAFLRAVNVGKRQYPMAELREALGAAGFEEVETHIQTGNVRLRTSMRSPARVRAALEQAMRADRGFEVPVVLMTPVELTEVYAEAQVLAGEERPVAHFLTLLAEAPTEVGARALESRSIEGEKVRVGARAVHLMLADRRYSEAVTGNAEVERHLGVATTRSLTVISKLAEKWGR